VDGVLAMTVLNRHDQVKQASAFKDEIQGSETTEAEVALTNTLINASMIQGFDFARYRDAYKDKLTKLIQLKVEGQEIVQVHDPEEPKIINLMEALKRSVAEAQATAAASGGNGSSEGTDKADLKQAPSAKARKGAQPSQKKRKVG
jgi:DNA end-binding protein Ku